MTENSSVQRKRRLVLAVIIILMLVVISAGALLFFLPNSKISDCTSTTGQTTGNESLLSNFAVACIRIENQNSTIMDGFVYVADSAQQQAQGFMNVSNFGNCNGIASGVRECDGMIFNFSSSQVVCFWMHDTLLPLQQDWIAANGTVTFVYQARPENDSSVCNSGKLVLETSPDAPVRPGDVVNLSSGPNS